MRRTLGLTVGLATGLGALAAGAYWLLSLPLSASAPGAPAQGPASATQAGPEASSAAAAPLPPPELMDVLLAQQQSLPSAPASARAPALTSEVTSQAAGEVAGGAVRAISEKSVAPTRSPPWPLRSTADMLAERSQGEWRLMRWQENPAVAVLQFPDLTQQGAALNRLAALVEKAGAPRDRLLATHELQTLIDSGGDNAQTFFGGHNYRLSQLVRFHALAARQGLSLAAEEQRLRQLFEAQGWWGAQAGDKVLISFTDEQPDDPSTPQDEGVDAVRRESVLRHELSHAIYFTDARYRARCGQMWRQWLSAAERQRIRKVLAAQGYDAQNEDLLINEAQALLFHTADTRAFGAASFGLTEARLAELRRRFAAGS